MEEKKEKKDSRFSKKRSISVPTFKTPSFLSPKQRRKKMVQSDDQPSRALMLSSVDEERIKKPGRDIFEYEDLAPMINNYIARKKWALPEEQNSNSNFQTSVQGIVVKRLFSGDLLIDSKDEIVSVSHEKS